MKTEHLVILALVVAGGGFFLYQQKKAADARAAAALAAAGQSGAGSAFDGFGKLAGALGTFLGNYQSADEDEDEWSPSDEYA
jgi:hypothetical protein